MKLLKVGDVRSFVADIYGLEAASVFMDEFRKWDSGVTSDQHYEADVCQTMLSYTLERTHLTAKKVHMQFGKKWILPLFIAFNESWQRKKAEPYRVVGYQRPRKGQWYLSGAIATAYKAPNDLGMTFLVIEPLRKKTLV